MGAPHNRNVCKIFLASFTKNHYETWQFVAGFLLFTGLCRKLRKTVEGSVS